MAEAGDIVILSQLAWSVARAFGTGRKAVPVDFINISGDADRLSEALRLLAETIHQNESIFSSAAYSLQEHVARILHSTQKTLDDLDSLVDRYMVLKKTETQGGFTIEKHWSEPVLANYRKMIWTTEKGNIQALRGILRMHENTISLITQTLQSETFDQVERPSRSTGNDDYQNILDDSLSHKLDGDHCVVTPAASVVHHNHPRRALPITPRSSRSTSSSNLEHPAYRSKRNLYSIGPPSPPLSPALQEPSSGRALSVAGTISSSASEYTKQSPLASSFPHEKHPEDERLAEYLDHMSISTRGSLQRPSEDDEASTLDYIPSLRNARRDSETLPSMLRHVSAVNSMVEPTNQFYEPSIYNSPHTPATSSLLTPSLLAEQTDAAVLHARKSAFLAQLFRNSAKLFDDHAVLAEYTNVDPEEPDPRFATELVPVATQCRICVIRKREHLPHGGTAYVTSIWIFSDDFSIRCQQRLPDMPESVPFVSFFTPEKVSLSGDTTLLHHGQQWGDPIASEARTSWVNFVFATENSASDFQSAIFGRKLMGSFQTAKTIVHHRGFKGKFAFEEQMCGIEKLRMWEEDGVSLPGAGGGVMALMHLSPSFGEGWLRWWINDSKNPIRVKADGEKHVRIKDVDFGVIHVGVPNEHVLKRRDTNVQHKFTNKKVSGMRIEFSSEKEQARFLSFVGRVQLKMLPLPDIR